MKSSVVERESCILKLFRIGKVPITVTSIRRIDVEWYGLRQYDGSSLRYALSPVE